MAIMANMEQEKEYSPEGDDSHKVSLHTISIIMNLGVSFYSGS